jgi:cytidyltransferase-like protein
MRAYLGGTFDVLHSGHLKLLRYAKLNFEEVWVGLNTDAFIERYKGKKPVMSFGERWDILSELKCVDQVITNYEDEDSRLSIIEAKPTVIVAGSDWDRDRLMNQMNLSEIFLYKMKIDIHIYPYSDPVHSSDIKKRMG